MASNEEKIREYEQAIQRAKDQVQELKERLQ